MHENIAEVLISREAVQEKVQQLGEQLGRDYGDKNPLIICVLKGALIFVSDLIRAMDCPLSVDFMAVSSYGSSTKSSGAVQILKDLETGIEGRHVIIVEDIVDTGLTLSYLRNNLLSREPASLTICSLLDKPSRRELDIKPDYCGFVIPDKFVVGYGLDFDQQYRNLPYIGILKPEAYM